VLALLFHERRLDFVHHGGPVPVFSEKVKCGVDVLPQENPLFLRGALHHGTDAEGSLASGKALRAGRRTPKRA
jgi:hypothetical protein